VYLSIILYFLRRLFRRVMAPARKARLNPGKKYPCHINLFKIDDMGRLGRFYHVGSELMLNERLRSAAEEYLEKHYDRVFADNGGWTTGIGTDDADDGSFQELLDTMSVEQSAKFYKMCRTMVFDLKKFLARMENA